MQYKNNFDFLRLLAAFMVLFSHQFALLGRPQPVLDSNLELGALGVSIFFSISGYLVVQSWQRDPNLIRFALKRFLRIWPGLFVVTTLAAFVVGPIVSELEVSEYFQDSLVVRYMDNLRLRMNYQLPGVFVSNPFPNAVNGSTWTIPIEVRWYVYLAIAGALTLVGRRHIVLLAVIAFVIYHFGIYGAETNPNRVPNREYGLYFCFGALMGLYRDKWKSQRLAWAALIALAGISTYFMGQQLLGTLVTLAPLTVMLGDASTTFLRRFGRFGDLSYGVYIYAFVVQQTLVWYFGAELSFAAHFTMATAITLGFAWLSWHLVEKPVLAFKSAAPSSQRMAWF
ncbi:hypothetical protein GQ56_0134565 [Burkholderia paludis]|uniref:acyltransferase family protein n=1 Tax=Burkholderia paludis TaxID=1506587 RepID=UPI0004DB9097|nr:acyltransferase [Burkholderia paludis]KFG92915.1 hypothetical protein GQ56_0134565 [Burkholderia paludis]